MSLENVPRYAITLLAEAQEAHSGRAAHTLYAGPKTTLSQTVIALREGASLSEHENPGEATITVLKGTVRLHNGSESWEAGEGDFLVIPHDRHGLDALTDSVVMLTSAKIRGPL